MNSVFLHLLSLSVHIWVVLCTPIFSTLILSISVATSLIYYFSKLLIYNKVPNTLLNVHWPISLSTIPKLKLSFTKLVLTWKTYCLPVSLSSLTVIYPVAQDEILWDFSLHINIQLILNYFIPTSLWSQDLSLDFLPSLTPSQDISYLGLSPQSAHHYTFWLSIPIQRHHSKAHVSSHSFPG